MVISPSTVLKSSGTEINNRGIRFYFLELFCQGGTVIFRAKSGGYDKGRQSGRHQVQCLRGLRHGMRRDDIELCGFQHELACGNRAVGFMFSNQESGSHGYLHLGDFCSASSWSEIRKLKLLGQLKPPLAARKIYVRVVAQNERRLVH